MADDLVRHMNPECRRWAELADLEALEEPLPSDGPAFQRAHEATCADCAREAATWRVIKENATGVDSPVDEVEVENLVALAAAARHRRAFSARRKGAVLVVAGATACAAVIFLWFSGRLTQVPPSNPQAVATTPPTPSLQRQAALPSQAAASERPVERTAEAHCSEIVPGAIVCLEQGAALGRRALTGSERELEVVRGRVVASLAPQPPGTSFSLTTTKGKVTAVGTIFSVDVSADGSTVARVVEGKVLTRATGEIAVHRVHAGQALLLGEQRPRELSDSEKEADLALLSLSKPSEPSEHGAPRPSSAPKAAGPGTDQNAPPNTLEYARSLRTSGDFRRAAEVYRKIHAASPQSPSGRAALVSLGELLLTLQDPRGALNAFDSYLSGGGALAQEATFGRARALRALNRPAEERQAIERFLAAYPEAPQSRVLRARLAAIQK